MRLLGIPLSGEGRASEKLSKRSNQEWLDGLRGPDRNRVLEELRIVIIRGLRFGLKGKLDRKGAGEQIEDFAQDALIRILDNLDSFRGESRFTTWAQKIAIRVAFSELRRKQWQNVSLDQLLSPDEASGSAPKEFADAAPSPEDQTSSRMTTELITEIIDNELTPLQRAALQAIIMHGMPMEEVALQMNTNRNALYKLLHDARKKVRTALEERGLDAEEIIAEL